MRPLSALRTWLRRTDRFWDYLLGRRSPIPRLAAQRRFGLLQLEDRLVPDGRPLPFPVIAVGPGAGAGVVKLFDADTGQVLLNVTPFDNKFLGGIRVAVGDVTHDAYPDLVVAAGPGGGPHVRTYNGKTGEQLPGPLGSFFAYSPDFHGGVNVAVGDVTGDGTADIVTAADAGGGPHVKVFDGKTGAEAASFFAFEPEFQGGVRLAVGDFLGSGTNQVVLAAGVGGAPRVRVLQGGTWQPIPGPLGDFYAFDPADRGGVYVATGHVTSDGHRDLVAGAGLLHTPEVRAFDGMTGKVALSFLAFAPTYLGGVRVGTMYLDDDANADIVTGTASGTAPRVRTFSGATGKQVSGPAGDFDPGIGSALGGVNVASGNDPLTASAFLSASDVRLSVGDWVEVEARITADPSMSSAGITGFGWGDGSFDTNSGSFNPEVSQTTQEFTHAYATAGAVGPGGQWIVQSAAISETTTASDTVSATVTALPEPTLDCLDCATGGAGGMAQRRLSWQGQLPQKRLSGGVSPRDGIVTVVGAGIGADGFGSWFGQSALWSNASYFAAGSNLGNGWANWILPSGHRSGSSFVVTNGPCVAYYDGQGTPDGNGNYSDYDTRHADDGSGVTYDSTNDEFKLDDGSGTVVTFYGFSEAVKVRRGTFKSRTDPGGGTTAVTAWDNLGRPTEVQRSVTVGGTTTVESYLTEYLSDTNASSGEAASVTLRRKVGTGSWATVRKLEYEYYTPSESNGNVRDLKRSTVKDGSGNVLDQWYYRYYTGDTYSGGTQIGYQYGLKYAVGPVAYARLKAAAGGTDAYVDTASDSTVATYADQYFEYDASKRVTKLTASGAGCSLCTGGQGTYTYAYSTSTNATGYNSWKYKAVETRPDGSTETVYANAFGEVMLTSHRETSGSSTHWDTFYRYGEGSGSGGGSGSGSGSGSVSGGGQLALVAHPSAVTGYDDSYADLVHYTSGNAQYLADSTGLVETYAYNTSTTATDTSAGGVTGYLQTAAIRRGETGTDVPQRGVTYYHKTAGGATANPVAASTVYRNTDGTGGQTTSYSYTWFTGTTQAQTITTTLPTVTTSQNGPNTATTSTVAYDTYGRLIWAKDGGGFLTYAAYDPVTGAATKTIRDVDTTQTSTFVDLPSGWSTPSGGGLHLTTTYETDGLGRTTKLTDPLGHVTYTVFLDTNHEVRTYPGWDSTNNVPTGPTQVARDDRANGYTETLTMAATPSVSGGRPTGAESIGSLQSLSRVYRNAAGQAVYTDAYFNLSPLTYTTSTGFGTLNTHFYRATQDYDERGRPDRAVTAAGTITRTVRDGQGRPTSVWGGTDDTPTSGEWSPTNTAGTNLVKVREFEYDGGGVGDRNLTKVTDYPGLSAAARVTQAWYDWRDRAVAVKSGVETSESTSVNRPIGYTESDNLGEVVASELYDGDGVSITTTSGVPNRPSSSLLRAKATTLYDELGRAYRTQTWSVDPSSGSVSTYALTTDTWFDSRGNVIKTAAPGGLVTKTAIDGAGRAVTVYTTDGGGDSGYSDAGTVTGDAVLQQAETTYDAAGNVLQTTARQRFHDETGTGALGSPSSGVHARVSYSALYYDLGNRLVASVEVGTNGGSAYTRPSSVPSRSDTVLVTSTEYNAAGLAWKVTDPRGLETWTTFDNLGRTTKTIENYVDGTVSDTDDKTTEYGYGPAGLTSLTADLTGGGVQTTAWVYGVTQSGGSGLDSNDIVGATRWPDPSTGAASSSEQDTVTVNGLGQTATSTDRNGTVHTLTYDVLGRLTADAATTLGTGIDGTVRRIETAYDGQGNPYLVTSYDAASSGSVVNQVQRAYNGLGQLITEYQAHSGSVNTSTTPKVQYAYSEMASGVNHSRLTSMTYPSGYVLTSNYSSGLNSSISRLSSLSDSGNTLESYDYLGLGTVVRRSHPQPGVDLTYVKFSGESAGDAGDQYTGIDRFGRVVDQRWIVASTGVATDRFQYGYDRNGDLAYRDNLVNSAFGEVFTHDGLTQIATFKRGTLNSSKTDVSGTPARTQSWDYDSVGNWDSVTSDGTTQSRTANRQNEITSISSLTTPTYDASGNMIGTETGKQLIYDSWNHLTAVKSSGGSTLQSMAYDGLGRRVSITADSTTTALYYSDKWQVVEERVSDTAKIRYIWSSVKIDSMIARDRDTDGNESNGLEERLWTQQDANCNIVSLVSDSGSILERYTYDPYGTTTVYSGSFGFRSNSSYDMRYLWHSKAFSAVQATYGFQCCDVSPTLGRSIQFDTLLLVTGDINFYRWEHNAPMNHHEFIAYDHPRVKEEKLPVNGNVPPGTFWVQGDAINDPSAQSFGVVHTDISCKCPTGNMKIRVGFGGGGNPGPTRPFDPKRDWPLTANVGGTLKFGTAAGKPCLQATIADIRSCIDNRPPPRAPYSAVFNNCQHDIQQTCNDCCLHGFDPITTYGRGFAVAFPVPMHLLNWFATP